MATSLHEKVARLLALYWPVADVEEDAAEIRDIYTQILRADADDVTSAVGLTVLACANLRSHLERELDLHYETDYCFDGEVSQAWCETEPFPGLGSDDAIGRDLAAEVVRSSRRVLQLDERNNLAAFALGFGLEWLCERTAATWYNEAFRLDPGDDAARLRAKALGGRVEDSDPPLDVRHSHGFYLLTMTNLISHNGTEAGWSWLLTDLVEMKHAVESHLEEWVKDSWSWTEEEGGHVREPAFKWDTLRLLVHSPGQSDIHVDLRGAVHQSADGEWTIGWPDLDIPASVNMPLPKGEPIRLDGQMYFFGTNEHDDPP